MPHLSTAAKKKQPAKKEPTAPKAKAANADKEKAPVKDEPKTPAAASLRIRK
jgi:hypothetical protein